MAVKSGPAVISAGREAVMKKTVCTIAVLTLGLAACSRGSLLVGARGGDCEGPQCTETRDLRGDELDSVTASPRATRRSRTKQSPMVSRQVAEPIGAPAGSTSSCRPGEFCEAGPQDECSPRTLSAEPLAMDTSPDLLIAFDRSATMADSWGFSTKWQVARDALRNAVEPTTDAFMQTGVVFFPASGLSEGDDDAGVADECSVATSFSGHAEHVATTLEVEGAASSYRASTSETRPLLDALQALDALLAERTNVTVLIVAGGGPTCDWEEQIAVETASQWQLKGTRTHVITLPGVSEEGARRFERLAVAGGTSGQVGVSEPQELTREVRRVLGEALERGSATCLYELASQVTEPDMFAVVMRQTENVELEVPRDWWALEADGRHVRLKGPACDSILAGLDASFEIEFRAGCPTDAPMPR